MQNILSDAPKVKQISDEALLAAVKAAQDRGATDAIPIVRKYVPAPAKLKDCPPDKREALVDDLNRSGCPADAAPVLTKLAEVAKGHAGQFVIVGLRDGCDPIIEHVPNIGGDVIELIAAAARINANNGYSIHIAPALFSDDLAPGRRGTKKDVVAVLAIVVDFDRLDNPETRKERLIFNPWCENESSPGGFHCWRFLDRPYKPEEAEDVIAAVHRIAGVADNTSSLDHLYRLPGSINIPTAAKIKAGKREPGIVYAKLHLDPELADLTAPNISMAEVRAAIANKHGVAALIAPKKAQEDKGDWTDADWEQRATAKREIDGEQLHEKLDQLVRGSKRSQGLSKVYGLLRSHGYSPAETIEVIHDNRNTIMGDKALNEKGEEWLRADIIRWWKKQKPIPTVAETFSHVIPPQEDLANAEEPEHWSPSEGFRRAIEETIYAESILDQFGKHYTPEDYAKERKRLERYLDLFNKHFCVALIGTTARKAMIVEFKDEGKQLAFMDIENFHARFKGLKVWLHYPGKKPKWYEVSTLWFDWPKRRQYLGDGLVFAPGWPLEWEGGLNRWRDFAIEPKPGDWTPIQDLIENGLCGSDTDLSAYTFNWLAHLVQKPGELIGSALVFRSADEGVGKGTFGRVVGSFFGRNYSYITKGKDVTGQFNGSLGECLFAVLDEAMFAGDHEAAEALKVLVSDQERRSEEKFVPKEDIPNHLNFMVFGNNDWLVRTGLSNRRYVYINTPKHHSPSDKFWDQFHIKQVRPTHRWTTWALPPLEMRQAMLHDLLNRDLSNFNARDIPHTLEEGLQKQYSMNGFQQFIRTILNEGEVAHPVIHRGPELLAYRSWAKEGFTIRRVDFQNAVRNYWKDQKERGTIPTEDKIGRDLLKLLPGCVDPNARPRDVTINPDYKRCYKFAPLDECRAAFVKAFGSPLEWEPLPEFADAESPSDEPTLDKELGIMSEAPND